MEEAAVSGLLRHKRYIMLFDNFIQVTRSFKILWVNYNNITERIRFNGQATKGLCTDDLVR